MRSLLVVLLLFEFASVASAAPKPEGKNCRLSAPPSSAGEDLSHGAILRIYPRARDIDNAYTGCQLLWAPNKEKWMLISITEVAAGDPVGIWTPGRTSPELTNCRYKDGRVVSGVAETCAAPQFLLKESLAPGCVKKLQASIAEGGLGAARPAGCEYE